jgi:hypothetical protein
VLATRLDVFFEASPSISTHEWSRRDVDRLVGAPSRRGERSRDRAGLMVHGTAGAVDGAGSSLDAQIS